MAWVQDVTYISGSDIGEMVVAVGCEPVSA